MCRLCKRLICPATCPNAPLPKAIGVCKECGSPIYPWSDCLEKDGDYYCEDCMLLEDCE